MDQNSQTQQLQALLDTYTYSMSVSVPTKTLKVRKIQCYNDWEQSDTLITVMETHTLSAEGEEGDDDAVERGEVEKEQTDQFQLEGCARVESL